MTQHEAYLAMFAFLEAHYQRVQSDDNGALFFVRCRCSPMERPPTQQWLRIGARLVRLPRRAGSMRLCACEPCPTNDLIGSGTAGGTAVISARNGRRIAVGIGTPLGKPRVGLQIGIMLIGLAGVGCDRRTPVVVASLPSPDGAHVMWVMNEYGGLGSGVVSVHIADPGEKPSGLNEVLRTPECTATQARWTAANTVTIAYDDISVSSFEAELPRGGARAVLLDRRTAGDSTTESSGVVSLPCDPY